MDLHDNPTLHRIPDHCAGYVALAWGSNIQHPESSQDRNCNDQFCLDLGGHLRVVRFLEEGLDSCHRPVR